MRDESKQSDQIDTTTHQYDAEKSRPWTDAERQQIRELFQMLGIVLIAIVVTVMILAVAKGWV